MWSPEDEEFHLASLEMEKLGLEVPPSYQLGGPLHNTFQRPITLPAPMNEVVIQEHRALVGSTGTKVWNSSLLLAHWIVEHGEQWISGRSLLEVGCGTGLPGLVAKKAGAARVRLTDGCADVLPLCQHSIEVNGLHNPSEIVTGLLNFSDELSWAEAFWTLALDNAAPRHPRRPDSALVDIIIGADIFLSAYNTEGLLAMVDEVLSRPSNTEADQLPEGYKQTFIGCTVPRPGLGPFKDGMLALGFQQVVSVEQVLPESFDGVAWERFGQKGPPHGSIFVYQR